MGLETGNTIAELNASWPLGSDPKAEGDDHFRLLKTVFQNDVVSAQDGGTFLGYVEFTSGAGVKKDDARVNITDTAGLSGGAMDAATYFYDQNDLLCGVVGFYGTASGVLSVRNEAGGIAYNGLSHNFLQNGNVGLNLDNGILTSMFVYNTTSGVAPNMYINTSGQMRRSTATVMTAQALAPVLMALVSAGIVTQQDIDTMEAALAP